MKPEDKANELYNKINRCIPIEASFSDSPKQASDKMIRDHKATIEICLIAVDEILKSDPLSPSKFDDNIEKLDAYHNCESEAYEYWKTVKEEINKV